MHEQTKGRAEVVYTFRRNKEQVREWRVMDRCERVACDVMDRWRVMDRWSVVACGGQV